MQELADRIPNECAALQQGRLVERNLGCCGGEEFTILLSGTARPTIARVAG